MIMIIIMIIIIIVITIILMIMIMIIIIIVIIMIIELVIIVSINYNSSKAQLALTSEASSARWGLPPRPPPLPSPRRGERLWGGSEGTIDHNHIPQKRCPCIGQQYGKQEEEMEGDRSGPTPMA